MSELRNSTRMRMRTESEHARGVDKGGGNRREGLTCVRNGKAPWVSARIAWNKSKHQSRFENSETQYNYYSKSLCTGLFRYFLPMS